MRDMVKKTEAFLREAFANSAYFQENLSAGAYRLEHSYRVANICGHIARAEGFDPDEMVVAGLLHDLSYCEVFQTQEDWKNHGRRAAQLARTFLQTLGLPADRVEDICYGIAIHVDDTADFEGTRTKFAETISDADNIDRFDAYRIYETLEYKQFSGLSLEKKRETVASMLQRLRELLGMKLATRTAEELWRERLAFYIAFYEKLQAQLNDSAEIKMVME